MDPQELADEAFLSCPEIVVITGGEPAIHDLQDLAYQLRSRNLPVHLETCGAFHFGRNRLDHHKPQVGSSSN